MARHRWLLTLSGIVAVGLAFCEAAAADRRLAWSLQPDVPQTVLHRIRCDNGRIREVLRYAIEHSSAFDDLVQTLEQQSRFLYVEEGSCPDPRMSCLNLMSTRGRGIRIRIDPRQNILAVAVRLAHELYHASEITRDPWVVDDDGVRALYERIGYRNRDCSDGECWETRAAVAFETLVAKELNSR